MNFFWKCDTGFKQFWDENDCLNQDIQLLHGVNLGLILVLKVSSKSSIIFE